MNARIVAPPELDLSYFRAGTIVRMPRGNYAITDMSVHEKADPLSQSVRSLHVDLELELVNYGKPLWEISSLSPPLILNLDNVGWRVVDLLRRIGPGVEVMEIGVERDERLDTSPTKLTPYEDALQRFRQALPHVRW